MNRQTDFDQMLVDWIDQGADRAPERFVWAALEDVERTAQRGAWQASTEDFFMRLKRAAPILGIAAVVVLAIIAYQAAGNADLGVIEPTPRPYTRDDLAIILVTDANAPEGTIVEPGPSGHPALTTPLRPGGAIIDDTAFVDAVTMNIDHTLTGGYVSWGALFETARDAEQAFDFLETEHESDDGWGMQRSSSSPSLGDQSLSFTGAAYDWDTSGVYLWRVNNLVLAAVGVGDFAADKLRSIADGMDARAE